MRHSPRPEEQMKHIINQQPDERPSTGKFRPSSSAKGLLSRPSSAKVASIDNFGLASVGLNPTPTILKFLLHTHVPLFHGPIYFWFTQSLSGGAESVLDGGSTHFSHVCIRILELRSHLPDLCTQERAVCRPLLLSAGDCGAPAAFLQRLNRAIFHNINCGT